MTRDLQTEIRHYIGTHGPATADTIARGIRARLADVRDELRHGPFWRIDEGGRGIRYDKLFVPSQPVPASATDTDLLFHILRDGRWHSLFEINRRAEDARGYGMTVHSRASDLRKRGHVVEQRSEAAGRRRRSFYRLVLGEAAEKEAGSSGPAASPSTTGPLDEPRSPGSSNPAFADADSQSTGRDGGPGILELFPAPARGAYSGEAA